MNIILSRYKSTYTIKLVNFLILVIFKIKDFKGHYLKLMVLQGYTWFADTNIVYFNKYYISKAQKHICN